MEQNVIATNKAEELSTGIALFSTIKDFTFHIIGSNSNSYNKDLEECDKQLALYEDALKDETLTGDQKIEILKQRDAWLTKRLEISKSHREENLSILAGVSTTLIAICCGNPKLMRTIIKKIR